MVQIKPFQGLCYNPEKVNIQDVVTEPYDKISPVLQEKYYKRSPYSAVRLVLGKEEKGDNEKQNKYTRAAELLKKWEKAEVLVQAERPQLYAYHQEFKLDGTKNIRKGFMALVKLEDFSTAIIRPHEKTLSKPKADRLDLMRATHAQLEHIFMLYRDREKKINALLGEVTSAVKPLFNVKDEYGSRHKVWRVWDDTLVEAITGIMKDKYLLIADGHHRYETACNFAKENGAWGQADNPYNYQMMTLFNMDDEGLTILPTHRLLHGLAGLKKDGLLQALSAYFTITKHRYFEEMSAEQAKATPEQPCFGLYIDKEYNLLKMKDISVMDREVQVDRSMDWKHLDVSILHTLILEKLLGITLEHQAQQTNLTYVRYAEEAISAVDKGEEQLAFFLNPTRIDQVEKIAELGETMPQKSTDFFPKLLTGLVMHKLA